MNPLLFLNSNHFVIFLGEILQCHPQHRRGDEARHGGRISLQLDVQSQQHDDKVRRKAY